MPRVTGQERLFNSIGSSYLSTDTISIKNSPGETNWVTRCQTGNPGLLTITRHAMRGARYCGQGTPLKGPNGMVAVMGDQNS